MPLYALDDRSPTLPEDNSHWIAPGARVIGDVVISEGVSIWFNAVLRGDNEPITIGAKTNIQDGAVGHTDPGFPLDIGAGVTVGHMAIVHGCVIGEGSLIGMGAVVLNGARIGHGCLVGAGALVTEGKVFEDNTLIVGQPARAVRLIDDRAREMLAAAALKYHARRDLYGRELREI